MKPRLLLVDDMISVLESMKGLIMDSGDYEVVCAKTAEEAISYLENERFHIILSDVRLRRDWDESDESGIQLLQHAKEIDETIGRIIITAFRNAEVNRKANYFAHIAYKDYSKEYLELINRVLEDEVQINFKLQIDPKPSSNWVRLVENTEHLGEVVDDELTLADLSEELEELFRKVFYRRIRIRFIPQTPGRSGTGIAMVQPYTETGEDIPSIVKFNLRKNENVKREAENYEQYVRNKIMTTTRNSDKIYRTKRMEAIEYQLAGGVSTDDIEEFFTAYKKYSADQIKEYIHSLFYTTLNKWWHSKPSDTNLTVADLYIRQWNLDQKKSRMENTINRILASPGINHALDLQVREKEIYIGAFKLELPNPVWFAFESNYSFSKANFLQITHGDMNGRNIILGNNLVWLIDFYHTGYGHSLRDFVKLESSVKFEMLRCENMLSRLKFDFFLSEQSEFGDLLPYEDPYDFPEIVKACEVIQYLRHLSKQIVQTSKLSEEYFTGLLFNGLQKMSWHPSSSAADVTNPVNLCHAFIAAALASWKLMMMVTKYNYLKKELPMDEYNHRVKKLEENLIVASNVVNTVILQIDSKGSSEDFQKLRDSIEEMITSVRTDLEGFNRLKNAYKQLPDPMFENQIYPYINRIEKTQRYLEVEINPRLSALAERMLEVADAKQVPNEQEKNLLRNAVKQISQALEEFTDPILKLGGLAKAIEGIIEIYRKLNL